MLGFPPVTPTYGASCLDKRNECIRVCFRYDFGNDRVFSLKYACNDSLAYSAPALNLSCPNVFVHVFRFAAKVAFVGLDFAPKGIAIFSIMRICLNMRHLLSRDNFQILRSHCLFRVMVPRNIREDLQTPTSFPLRATWLLVRTMRAVKPNLVPGVIPPVTTGGTS